MKEHTYYIPVQDRTYGHDVAKYDPILRGRWAKEDIESPGSYDGVSTFINSLRTRILRTIILKPGVKFPGTLQANALVYKDETLIQPPGTCTEYVHPLPPKVSSGEQFICPCGKFNSM